MSVLRRYVATGALFLGQAMADKSPKLRPLRADSAYSVGAQLDHAAEHRLPARHAARARDIGARLREAAIRLACGDPAAELEIKELAAEALKIKALPPHLKTVLKILRDARYVD